MMSDSLFDEPIPKENLIRNAPRSAYLHLANTNESEFSPIRGMLDDWYSKFPEEDKKDLIGRFRSPNDIEHYGAFFELLLLELHLRLGALVTSHQETNTGKGTLPDFLVTDGESRKSFVEATIVTGKTLDRQASEARLNDLLMNLNRRIESPDFWLSMNRKGFPSAPVSGKNIAKELSQNLGNLDHKDISRIISEGDSDRLPKWTYSLEGCTLTFEPFPKGRAKGTHSIQPIALQMSEMEFVDNRTPIRRSIRKKANRYGKLEHPFVIALSCIELVDEIDAMEALFGQEQFHLPIHQGRAAESDEISFSRKRDGAWTQPMGSRNTRISAVLIARHLRPWSIGRASVCLYHNPWAEMEYTSVLNTLDQSKLEGDRMVKIEGRTLSAILETDTYFD